MATPHSTPRYPGAPNPTPRNTGRLPRAPIHNPYDKFTQPEFDAWVDDITGALKRALGRDDAPAVHTPVPHVKSRSPEEEDVIEDSFAEVRARRLAKGKDRAREEDFEDEGVYEQLGEGSWDGSSDGEEYESSGQENEEESPRQCETEVIDLLSDDEGPDEEQEAGSSDEEAIAGPAPVYDDEAEDSEGGSDDDVQERAAVDDDEEGHEGSDASTEDGDPVARSSPALVPSSVHDVTEILDSDEEEEAEEEVPARRAIPPRFSRKPGIVVPARKLPGGYQGGLEEDDDHADEEVHALSPVTMEVEVDVQDPWRGPRTFAEDLYTGGDVLASALKRSNPHVLPNEEDLDELVDDDDDSTQPPDIPDPWEGPRTYAEDFYSGGDVHPESLEENMTPSHLTPREDQLYIPGITSTAEQSFQPVADKFSHPVADTSHPVDDGPYADVENPEQVLTNAVDASVETAHHPASPSPTHLTKHVDWNWPPAFPGKIATGPGHLVGEQSEIIAISDEEDDEDVTAGPSAEAPATLDGAISTDEQAAFADYADFGLYEMDPPETLPDMQGAFEPVSINELDFGDLPPSRGERSQDAVLAYNVNKGHPPDAAGAEAAEAPEILEYSEGKMEDAETPANVVAAPEPDVVVEEVDDEDEEDPLAKTTDTEMDVVSVSGDGADTFCTEYLVEEVTTHGRCTAEPEGLPQDEPLTTESAEAASVQVDIDTTAASGSEYPAPVSADPTVPDPASIAPTPASPASLASPVDSIASSSGEKESEATFIPVHTALFPTLRKNAMAHTSSGLFTPLTAGSITPELQIEDTIVNGDAGVVEEPSVEPKEVAEVKVTDLVNERVPVEDGAGTAEHASSAAAVIEPSATMVLSNETGVVEIAPRGVFVPPSQLDICGTEASHNNREDYSSIDDRPEETDSAQTSTGELHPLDAQRADSQSAELQRGGTPSSDGDVDAEGELDPDYVRSEDERAESLPATAEEPVLPIQSVDDDDPFVVKKADDTLPPDHGPTQEAHDDDHGSIASSSAEKEPIATTETAEVSGTSQIKVEQGELVAPQEAEPIASWEIAPIASQDTEPIASQETEAIASRETVVDENRNEARMLKRKRGSSLAEKPTRMLRSRTTKSLENGKAPDASIQYKKGKGKGKRRAREESDDEDAFSVASEITSGASSVAAQQLLIPESCTSSRASSVVSNAPSTYSGLSQTSPTTMRTVLGGANQPIAPFRHDGGILRHHHGARLLAPAAAAAPVIPAPVPPPASQRKASNSPSNASDKSSRASAEPTPSAASQPVRLPQSLQPSASRPSIGSSVSSSSPVTRANCRYHTISIPRSEHGRRIHFAVPGCSLGNGELMKEEHIQDHGNVDSKDLDKLLPCVEQLNLSSYLLGILRQLVGVDLLRENEVYYLPKFGDKVKSKWRPRANSTQGEAITRAQRDSISARTLSNGAAGRSKDASKDPTFMRPPHSQASVSTSGGSASHAGKLSARGSATTSASFSGSDLSDLEDEEEDIRPQKRAKEEHSEPEPGLSADHKAEETGSAQAPATNGHGTASSSAASGRLHSRRSRKLGVDAAAYKPEGGESDGSVAEEEDASKKRKRGRARGTKRKGAEENGDAHPTEGTSERPKRRRKTAPETTEAAR